MDHPDSLPPVVPYIGPMGAQVDVNCLFGWIVAGLCFDEEAVRECSNFPLQNGEPRG